MARKWIKIWVAESLRGTMRVDFTPAERGVWYDLLALAGDCRLDGIIAAGPSTPYPNEWIAGTLNIPLELLTITITKCQSTNRISLNGNGITILNWKKYQSEYERQKPYRRPTVTSEVTPTVTSEVTEKLPVEVEVEVRSKKKINTIDNTKRVDTLITHPSFISYFEQCRIKYKELDMDKEMEGFKLYWYEDRRILQRPKLAFRNWLERAMKYKKEHTTSRGIKYERVN